jgi:hypothetical protein
MISRLVSFGNPGTAGESSLPETSRFPAWRMDCPEF